MEQDDPSGEWPLIAALPVRQDVPVDALLADVAAQLAAEGLRTAGFLQRDGVRLEDLTSGALYPITQDLGPGSSGCRLDPAGLALAAAAGLAALERGADLLVIPRFGKAEIEGEGMRGVIGRACELGVPTLVGVRESAEPAWETFAGGLAEWIAPERQAVASWCRTACAGGAPVRCRT
ncbi:Nucleoside-triphosphatase THEP1 [[Luteovulum] sphaeroides subsp. megalophilum]|uniref:DUF2478 domain-containing protein n=1 Tax=Cereibacter sphaeroides TaxID=1063 RepID=UPI000B716E2A|nr:DUF2478 domain-containing protein [Cereibacter sphaeroides]SNS68679.1 Nucleoside-triphosphatase THEP1 [[Luteovulum] sphaeroides subsp. megalophilum]